VGCSPPWQGSCLVGSGDSMSCYKFLLLSVKVHAELAGAFFHSGPQVVTQLAIFWSGAYSHDFQVYISAGTSGWVFAWLEIGSPILNFTSLLVSGIAYCKEPGPPSKQISSHLCILSTGIYRVFVFSVMFKLAPLISSTICVFFYLNAVLVHRLCGDGVESILVAYLSLYFPCGHTTLQGGKPGTIPSNSGVPEVERSRINQEGLVLRVGRLTLLQTITSVLLLVPYTVYAEVWLFSPNYIYQTTDFIKTRWMLYVIPLVLGLASLGCYAAYYYHCTKARQAARTWTGLTPARSLLPASTVTVTDDIRPIPSSTPRDRPPTVQQPPTAPSAPPTDYRQPGVGYGDQVEPRPPSVLYPHLPSAPGAGKEGRVVLPPGNQKCDNEDCVCCAWMIEGPQFRSTATNKQYRFMPSVTCRDTSLIYLVTCRKCRKQYVGQTSQSLRERHYGHRREIDTSSSPLGKHFAETCGIDNWRIQIIDQCSSIELRRREGHWIHELSCLAPVGLNTRDEAAGKR